MVKLAAQVLAKSCLRGLSSVAQGARPSAPRLDDADNPAQTRTSARDWGKGMSADGIAGKLDVLEAIPGWYGSESIGICEFFLDQLDYNTEMFHGDVCEIGVFAGKSATHFAWHVRTHEKLYLIDVRSDIAQVAANVQGHTQGSVVAIQRFSSQVGPPEIADRSVRFMHIDGWHGRQAVKRDLDVAHRIMREEAVLVLDDFFHPEFAGVTFGAFEWMTQNPGTLEMVLVGFGKAYFCRPSFVPFYMEKIRDYLPVMLRRIGIENFTISRGTYPSDYVAAGIVSRKFDRDFCMEDVDYGNLDGPKGRILTF